MKTSTGMPDFTGNTAEWISQFTLPAEVEEQATALRKGIEPRFSRITWSETLPDGRTVDMTLDSQSDGLVRRLEDDGVCKVQRIMIANEIPLVTAIDLTTAPIILQMLKTNLSFPLQQDQRYRLQFVGAGKTSKWLSLSDILYKVTGSGESSELNPSLSGQYWRMESKEMSRADIGIKSTVVWLDDLQIFMHLDRTFDGKVQRFDWQNLNVIR